MDKLLKRLGLTEKHLSIIDQVFQQNYPLYAEVTKKLSVMPLYEELGKEIYVGGKKKGRQGYGRQMILNDLLQYMFMGRGYYFAVKGNAQREAFISTVMHVCNQLILMDDISVDIDLRNRMLDALEKGIGSDLFEDNGQEASFKALRAYGGKIIPPDDGKEFDDTLDSMLPKRVGAVPELLVYAYLIRKNYGYVVPLLQAQRLLGNKGYNKGYIVPPDYLLLRSKGEIFGIEVGMHKERQMSSFSTVTSTPVFAVGIGSGDQPQPYRCGRCQKWIIYCDEVIKLCSKNQEPNAEYVDCAYCGLYKGIAEAQAKCPYIIYHEKAHDYSGAIRKLRYHYACVKNDSEVKSVLSKKNKKPKLIAPIPWVNGLESLPQEIESSSFTQNQPHKEESDDYESKKTE